MTGIDAHGAEIPAEALRPQLLVEEVALVFEVPGWSVAGWTGPPPSFAMSLSMADACRRARFFFPFPGEGA